MSSGFVVRKSRAHNRDNLPTVRILRHLRALLEKEEGACAYMCNLSTSSCRPVPNYRVSALMVLFNTNDFLKVSISIDMAR